jgi:hypothetical protein
MGKEDRVIITRKDMEWADEPERAMKHHLDEDAHELVREISDGLSGLFADEVRRNGSVKFGLTAICIRMLRIGVNIGNAHTVTGEI